MVRCATNLLHIILSAALVLGIPLGTFPSAEAQEICAERMPTVDFAQDTGRSDTKTEEAFRAEAARSPLEIQSANQNIVDCLSDCFEVRLFGSIAPVSSSAPEKSKKYISLSSTNVPMHRFERIGHSVQPPAIALPEDTLLRTMRWRI